MFILKNPPMAASSAMTTVLIVVVFLFNVHSTVAQIGVCYGKLGNNLPSAQDTVSLYISNHIGEMRLYGPDHDTMECVQGTNIKVMLGVPNEDITSIASDQSTANEWVETNVVPYAKSIKYIAVGNEVKPYDPQASSILPAMQNIHNALISHYLDTTQIKVSTAIDTNLTQNSYPPSKTTFRDLKYITPIINFLTKCNSPLLVNIQPYFAYINDKTMSLDYALFTACDTVFTDEYNGKKYEYQNLFDAIYDSVYVALQKVVATQTTLSHNNKIGVNDEKRWEKSAPMVHSEGSWPSKSGFKHGRVTSNHHDIDRAKDKGCWLRSSKGGGPAAQVGLQPTHVEEAATIENAKTFYTNLIEHVKYGSPMTRGQSIETYLFAMFDENEKPGDEVERNLGLFTPDMCPKYGKLNFN